jgi:hypothetical protein
MKKLGGKFLQLCLEDIARYLMWEWTCLYGQRAPAGFDCDHAMITRDRGKKAALGEG